jgi:hypothetical protein
MFVIPGKAIYGNFHSNTDPDYSVKELMIEDWPKKNIIAAHPQVTDFPTQLT